MKDLVKRFFLKLLWWERVRARRDYYRGIARSNTNEHITKAQRGECMELFGPYIKLDTIFHDFYTEKTGVFDARYFPDDYYYAYLTRFYGDWDQAKVLDNKCFYPRIFGDTCAQPRTFAYRMNQFWYNEKMERIDYAVLSAGVCKEKALVIKQAADTYGGHGVVFVSQANGDILTAFNDAVKRIPGDIIVQYPIIQHPTLSKLHPSSVNTVRVFSMLRNEGVKIYSVVLRMGANNAKVDNASSGGVVCGVCEDGRLKDRAFTPNGQMFLTHPTTGVSFSDFVIPAYEDVIKKVKELHELIPHFKMASWDMSVSETGEPILVEVNLKAGELDFHQLTNGPIFGDDTEKVLQEVFGSKK